MSDIDPSTMATSGPPAVLSGETTTNPVIQGCGVQW
jgi:hypothetical protein